MRDAQIKKYGGAVFRSCRCASVTEASCVVYLELFVTPVIRRAAWPRYRHGTRLRVRPTTATTVTPTNREAARSRLERSRRLIRWGYPGSAALAVGGVLVLLARQSAILGIVCLVLAAVNVWNTRNWLRRVDALLTKLTQSE
jgi:hypothetical protein